MHPAEPADALDRVGNHEQAHPHALHETARERLRRDAHDGNAFDRGGKHRRHVIAADGAGEALQVEADQGIAVVFAANGDRVAQAELAAVGLDHAPVEHGAAFGTRERASRRRGIKHRIELFALDPHAASARIDQSDFLRGKHLVGGGATAGARRRHPFLIRQKLRRPHLAFAGARRIAHVGLRGAQMARAGRAIAHKIGDVGIIVVKNKEIARHGFSLPWKKAARRHCPQALFTPVSPHATLRPRVQASTPRSFRRGGRTRTCRTPRYSREEPP